MLYVLHNRINKYVIMGVNNYNQNIYNRFTIHVKNREYYIAVHCGFTTVR